MKTTVNTVNKEVQELKAMVESLTQALSESRSYQEQLSKIVLNLAKMDAVAPQTATPTKAPKTTKATKKATSSKEEVKTISVGGVVFNGQYVIVDGIKSSKARYAIQMSITERHNGEKISRDSEVYKKLATSKYSQVYEFKTAKDATAFYEEQKKRMG